MWNIKKSQSSEEAPARMLNPYEATKQELYKKLKFFGIYIAGIVVIPKLLRSIGLLEPLGIPLTRK